MKKPRNIRHILIQIEKIWKNHPELRLCQLIQNCFRDDIYYIEDEKLIKTLKEYYEK